MRLVSGIGDLPLKEGPGKGSAQNMVGREGGWTGSYCVVQLVSNLESSSLCCLLNAGIAGMCTMSDLLETFSSRDLGRELKTRVTSNRILGWMRDEGRRSPYSHDLTFWSLVIHVTDPQRQ